MAAPPYSLRIRPLKERNNDKTVSFQQKKYINGVFNSNIGSPTSRAVTQDSESLQGYDVVDYHKMQAARHLLPFTPFWRTKLIGTATGSYSSYYSSNQQLNKYDPAAIPLWTSWRLNESDLWNAAKGFDPHPQVIGAASKIFEDGFDALTFVAEARKTLPMITGVARRTLDLSQQLLNPGRAFDALARGFLEARYGWRPVLYDMENIHRFIVKSADRLRVKKSDGLETTKVVTTTSFTQVFSSTTQTYVQTDELSTSLVGTIIADYTPPSLLASPINTAWELIPYSFVVDWFVNIGEWLSALQFHALSDGNYRAGASKLVTLKRSIAVSSFVSHDAGSHTRGHNSVSEGTLVQRMPSTVPFKPNVSVNLDTLKVLDLTALAATKIRNAAIASRRKR